MTKKKTPISESVIVQYSRFWISGTIDQGNTIIQLHESVNTEPERYKVVIQDYFFLISVNKLLTWLKELRKIYPKFSSSIDKCTKQFPEAKPLRDMREHEIEYFKGEGQKQSKAIENIAKHMGLPSTITMKLDPQVSVKMGKNVFIGGRVDVSKTIEAVGILKSSLDQYLVENEKAKQSL